MKKYSSAKLKLIKYTGIAVIALLMGFKTSSRYGLNTNEKGKDTAKVLINDKGYVDFSKGTFSDNGVNLYVSKQGNLQYINLFDLNADGYPEVIINNDHDHYDTPDLLIYNNRKPIGLRSLTNPQASDAPAYQNFRWMMESMGNITRLPTEGGGRAVVADLNRDGYKDLVFTNFIHGSTLQSMPAYIYWGGQDGFNPLRRSLINADRSSALAVADLNGDGLDDLVLSNQGREHLSLETPDFTYETLTKRAGDRETTSYIYYQTEAGFSESHVEKITTQFALDVKTADLDKNGKPAMIFLETGAPGAVRIYRKNGDKWKQTDLLPVIAPKSPNYGKRINRELLVKDLNDDGYPDIFAPSEGKHAEIYWSDKGKFSVKNHTVLDSENSFSADAGDINKDGFTDLVVANFSSVSQDGKINYETNSYVWWGSKQGFSNANKLALPTTGATSARVADVNNTGNLDVLFAQLRNNRTYDVPSYIYTNSGKGISAAGRIDLQGFGTVGIVADDLFGNGAKDVILMSALSGKARHAGIDDAPGNEGLNDDDQHMYIYHGNADKEYSNGNLSRVPVSAPETYTAFADMDDDGKGDLIHLRAGGFRVSIRYDIYNFPQSNAVTEFPINFRANAVNIADYNKDGILDMLVTPIDGPQAILFIGLGNKQYKQQVFDFKHQAYSCTVGDINNDGLLDAITASHQEICILLGSNNGGNFHFLEPKIIKTDVLTTRVSLADFNKDGWLDIWSENLQNDISKSYDIESWVLINNKGSFSLANKRSFHTFGANGGSVAQLNNNGELDVVASNYHADISRRVGTFIIYPDEDGFPNDAGKVQLPSYSSGANLVMDFNADGYQDILVCNHTGADVYNGSLTPTGGMHGVGSTIFWGSSKAYSLANSTHVPSFGPHSRISADAGSASRRDAFEVYTSRNFVNNSSGETFKLTIKGRFNEKQYVTPQIILPSGAVTPTLSARSGNEVSYTVTIPKGKSFKYQLKLNSSNTGNGPVVTGVKLKAL